MLARLGIAPDRLRERWRAAGFDAAGLKRLLAISYPDDVGPLNRSAAVERLRLDRSRAATLTRLLYLEDAVPTGRVRAVFSAREMEMLARAGLFTRRGVQCTARLRVDPVNDLFLLGDRRFRAPDVRALRLPAGDTVYPPCSDSAILADAVSPVPGGDALDLCSGSGIQGLSVAHASRHVTAVDIGPRAVAMGCANAELNGVANFTALCGDLFAPVRGRRFDLIIANPPFVPSPHRGPAYHSGGPRGDRVLRRIAVRWGQYLKPGGRAFAISHLAVRRGEDVASVCRPWLADFPGRAMVLVLESGSPVDLAAAQALFALDGGFSAYAQELRSWVAYLSRHRIEQVVLLLLVAESGKPRSFEVAQAFQRTLPLPLSRAPRDLVADWLAV